MSCREKICDFGDWGQIGKGDSGFPATELGIGLGRMDVRNSRRGVSLPLTDLS